MTVLLHAPERLRIDALKNGEGFVVIDDAHVHPMIGPYSTKQKAEVARNIFAETLADERKAFLVEQAREMSKGMTIND